MDESRFREILEEVHLIRRYLTFYPKREEFQALHLLCSNAYVEQSVPRPENHNDTMTKHVCGMESLLTQWA